ERLYDKTTRIDNARLKAHLYCLSLNNFRILSQAVFLFETKVLTLLNRLIGLSTFHSLLVYANESVLQQKVRISRCGNGVERIYGRVLPTEFHKITSPERIFDHTVSLCRHVKRQIKLRRDCAPPSDVRSFIVDGNALIITRRRDLDCIFKAWMLDIKYSTSKNSIAQQYSEVNGTFISLTMNRNAHYIQVLTIHQPAFCTTFSECAAQKKLRNRSVRRTDNYLSVIIKAPSASGTRLSVVVQTARVRFATSARFLREALLLFDS
ncbi:hypothetical protein ALC56_06152, partial [Trachymyrmex septentrionalis]